MFASINPLSVQHTAAEQTHSDVRQHGAVCIVGRRLLDELASDVFDALDADRLP